MTIRHSFPVRVYFEDTDAGGIVYHGNFLQFAERARTESLRAGGYDHHCVMSEFSVMLVVKNIEIDYKSPGKLDDLLTVTTEVLAVGNTSLTMKQLICRDQTVLAEMKVIIVAITKEGKPQRWPPQLREIFVGSSEQT